MRTSGSVLASILCFCWAGAVPTPGLGAEGSWEQVAKAGPGSRTATALAYDSVRGNVVLYGGLGSSVNADTWTWDGSTWSRKFLRVAGPGPRQQHGMAFDSARGRVVLYGGNTGSSVLSDTWEWDGSVWRLAATSGPGPRYGYAMAYDSSRKKTLLFGGYTTSSGDARGDTWEWNGSSWKQVSTAGPSPRGSSAMAFDANRGRMVLYGGSGPLGDTWEWDGALWTQIATSGGPGPRELHRMASDNGGSRVLLYGGRDSFTNRFSDSWIWNGATWTQIAATGPEQRTFFDMAYDSARSRVVLFGGFVSPGDTWEWSTACDDEAAVLDQGGNVVFPPNLDPGEPINYEEVDQSLGNVTQLYGSSASGLDTWYPHLVCNPSIGGTVPPEAANHDLTGDLASLGITGATPEEISAELNTMQQAIAGQASQEADKMASAGPLVPTAYVPPAGPHCAEAGCGYVFGGRDIVFVHGLQIDSLFDKIFGTNPGALTTWPQDKAAFYGTGYWKAAAESYWADHIRKFLAGKGIRNRYLIVAYPSTQRLEVGAQAVLTQIADAMMTGEGVVDPTGRNDRSGFGTPSFVVVSHSTGGPVTDIALAASATRPNLGVEFIAQHCKGHVALSAVFSGSRLATAAVAASGYFTFVNPPPSWLCPLANLGILILNTQGSNNPTLTCPPNFLAVADSILVDLIPLVMQLKWGSYIRSTPVRTLTVVGGHPSSNGPIKHLLLPGFDDGVTNVDSQSGNPNTALFWPSGYDPVTPFSLVRLFDMGVFRTYPLRAIGYYHDQVGDRLLNPFSFIPHPLLAAAGPTPYVSPSGMVQPVAFDYGLTGGYNPLRRYPNHFSFLLSAADHIQGSIGSFDGPYYRNTFGEHNREETRVITDPAIYQPFSMIYPGDDAPLVASGQVPSLEEIVRGRKVTFKIKIFGRKFQKTWWIWKRRYHLLTGWENKVQMDYIYGSVLTQGIPACPPPTAANDCNHNNFADVCDLSNGTSRDCNRDRVPDECQVIVRPSIFLQPATQTVSAGQTVSFSVGANGSGPFSYQWFRNGVLLVNGAGVSGASTNVLTLTSVSTAAGGVYVVVVTSGCDRITSAAATLTVVQPPCALDPGLPQAGLTLASRAVLAQTFRPAHNGILTRIIHGLRDGGPASIKKYNLYVTSTLADGTPAWPAGVLYSALGLTAFASGSGVDGAVAVTGGPRLSTATTYALVLEPSGAGSMYWRGNSGASSYPNGAAYTRGVSGSTAWALSSLPKDFGFRLEGNCCEPATCVLDPGLLQSSPASPAVKDRRSR